MNLRKICISDYIIFLCMLFIGSDIFSINISGYTFRIVQILLLIVTIIFIMKKKYNLSNIFSIFLFILSNMISTMISVNQKGSLLYVFWTLFNYLFIFCLFYSWSTRNENEKIYSLWRKTYIIQGFLIILQFILALMGIRILNQQSYFGIPRPALWFYEPSYLATYFIVFFTISLYMYISTGGKKYRNDSIFATIVIGFITSSSGFIGMFISIIICILFAKQKILKKIKNIITILTTFIICFSIIYLIYPKIFDVFIGRLFKDGLFVSSGERMSGWSLAFNVFKYNEFFGVGPNAYQSYTGSLTPPTNVTLEILCCLGIIGLITFSIFILSVLIKGILHLKFLDGKNRILAKAIILSFIIFIIVLQFNQNYLRLYMWMHLGIIAGLSKKYIKIKVNLESIVNKENK